MIDGIEESTRKGSQTLYVEPMLLEMLKIEWTFVDRRTRRDMSAFKVIRSQLQQKPQNKKIT